MIDHADVQKWLDQYVEAWMTYDRQQIADLFNEQAVYYYSPSSEPVRGRDQIVADWIDDNQDAPGTYKAHYHPLVIEGDRAVAQGRSTYYEDDGKTVAREYDNLFVLRFDDQGRCLEYTDWYMKVP